MGKRELLLFLGFLAFGAVVYQVTAPPKDPEKEGFSFSKFVGQIQAEMKGEQAETEVERTASADAPNGSGRLVIPQFRGTLTIVGESRHDLEASLKARVYGMDDDQAKARAKDVNLTLKEDGEDLSAQIVLPKEFHRRPQLELTLRVPSQQAITLELRNGQADLRRVGQIRLENSRGKITMNEVGQVEGELENGDLEIVHARGVQLKLMRTKARLEQIEGELTLEADHGELRAQQLHGPAKLTLERLDCEIENVHAPIHIEPTRVGLEVRNVSAPLTVKGEHSRVLVTLDTAVPVTIETTDEPIDLRTPRQGVTIDAESVEGQIRVSETGSGGEPERSEEVERTEKVEPKEQVEHKERIERRERRERREPVEMPEPPQPSGTHGVPPPPPPPAPPAPAPSPTPSPDSDEHDENAKTKRAFLKLHGGGPKITLRNERGDIIIR